MLLGDNGPDWGMLGRLAAYALLAALGGAMGYLMRTLDKKQKISKGKALLEALAAGFVGMLVTMTCTAMHLSEEWTGVIVGVSGWLGANATIRMLESVVVKKLGISKSPLPESEAEHGVANEKSSVDS